MFGRFSEISLWWYPAAFYSSGRPSATLEMFPSWPMRFQQTPRVVFQPPSSSFFDMPLYYFSSLLSLFGEYLKHKPQHQSKSQPPINFLGRSCISFSQFNKSFRSSLLCIFFFWVEGLLFQKTKWGSFNVPFFPFWCIIYVHLDAGKFKVTRREQRWLRRIGCEQPQNNTTFFEQNWGAACTRVAHQ